MSFVRQTAMPQKPKIILFPLPQVTTMAIVAVVSAIATMGLCLCVTTASIALGVLVAATHGLQCTPDFPVTKMRQISWMQ